MKERVIEEKSFEFSVMIVDAVRKMKKETHEYELASQLLRSGTSIGANVAEARYAQSEKDFISKHSIALKEANEVKYWLKLLCAVGLMPEETGRLLIGKAVELIRILTSIIQTTQNKHEKQPEK